MKFGYYERSGDSINPGDVDISGEAYEMGVVNDVDPDRQEVTVAFNKEDKLYICSFDEARAGRLLRAVNEKGIKEAREDIYFRCASDTVNPETAKAGLFWWTTMEGVAFQVKR